MNPHVPMRGALLSLASLVMRVVCVECVGERQLPKSARSSAGITASSCE